MPTNNYKISDELLAAFIDGNCSEEECCRVAESVEHDHSLFETAIMASMAADIAETDDDDIDVQSIHFPARQLRWTEMESFHNVAESINCEGDDICSIKSEQLILSSFGINVSTDALIKLSIDKGWYDAEHGTPILCVGNILENYGLKIERRCGGSIDDVRRELSTGGRVILCVDSCELMGDVCAEYYEDVFSGEIADHAVVVAELASDGEIVIHDPATSAEIDVYPLSQLLDAWADSDYYMIIVKQVK